jgi:hypothetical protein
MFVSRLGPLARVRWGPRSRPGAVRLRIRLPVPSRGRPRPVRRWRQPRLSRRTRVYGSVRRALASWPGTRPDDRRESRGSRSGHRRPGFLDGCWSVGPLARPSPTRSLQRRGERGADVAVSGPQAWERGDERPSWIRVRRRQGRGRGGERQGCYNQSGCPPTLAYGHPSGRR